MFISILYLCIFLATFNLTAPIMAEIYVVGELGGSSQIASYNILFFGLGNAFSFPLARFLGRHFEKLSVLVKCLCFFFLATIFCSIAKTFFLFVFFRFLAGVFSGVFFPLSMSLINEQLNEEQKTKAFNILALLTTITPVLGATVGGFLAYSYHWHWVFSLQLPLILFAICFLSSHVKRNEQKGPLEKFDKIGYLSYLISISSFLSFFCFGQELDWFRSSLLNTLLVIGIVFFIFFVLWEYSQENPFLNLKLFKNIYFSLSVFLLFFMTSAYFGMIILLTVWLHFDVNYTPIWISLLFFHMLIAGALLFLFMVKWIKKIHPLIPVLFAVCAFGYSCFYSTTFNVDVNFTRIAIARILAGFGLAFFLFPLFTLSLRSTPKEQKEDGIALFQSIRLLASALGISLYPTLWYRRQIFYHDRLGSSLTIYAEQTTEFFAKIRNFSSSPLESIALLEQALSKQASSLALADVFYFMGILMIFLFIISLAFFLKNRIDVRKREL